MSKINKENIFCLCCGEPLSTLYILICSDCLNFEAKEFVELNEKEDIIEVEENDDNEPIIKKEKEDE